MKSINRKDFIVAGSVMKVHGTKGELKVELIQNIKLKKWAFLEIKGKPVPFYITEQSGTTDFPVVKFEYINTPVQANRFVGLKVLTEKKNVKKQSVAGYESLIGFLLTDETTGEIGIVEEIMELPQQLLFQTNYKNKEVLIPAVDEFIITIDDKKQVITLNLPEGFLAI